MRPSIGGYSCATSNSSPPSISTGARSDVPSRRRSSPSRTAPASFKARCRSRTSSSRPVLCSTGWRRIWPIIPKMSPSVRRSRADRYRRGAAPLGRRSSSLLFARRLGAGGQSITPRPVSIPASLWSIAFPYFLASDPAWAQKFRNAGLPIIGDDIKSQLGATIVHRALARLFGDRGVSLDRPTSSTRGAIPIFSICSSGASEVEEDLEDRIRPVPVRRAARARQHPYRAVRLCSMATGQ